MTLVLTLAVFYILARTMMYILTKGEISRIQQVVFRTSLFIVAFAMTVIN